MNALVKTPDPTPTLTDAQLIALDAVVEYASMLCCESAALLAAAASCDVAATEARFWTHRRVLMAAIATWREAVPALSAASGGAP